MMREEKIAIFIDTNVFEKIGFNFDEKNELLNQYKKLLKNKKYENISVSIIDREIKQHIDERIEDDCAKIKKHCKWIYDLVDSQTIDSKIKKNLIEYERFKKEANTIEVGIDKINPEIIMNKYFNLEFPFELGKRNEFKDAFFVEAVLDYANNHETYISYIVITNDSGIKKTIDHQNNKKIMYFDSIQDFLDSLVDYSKISKMELLQFLKGYDFKSQLENKININIENIEEAEIDIEEYECMGIYSPKIIKKTQNSLTIICDMNVGLIGNFKCLDYDNSYYSYEEDEYLYKQYKEQSYLGYFCQTVIDIKIENKKYKSAEIIDLPAITIDYESFMSLDDYFKKENNT